MNIIKGIGYRTPARRCKAMIVATRPSVMPDMHMHIASRHDGVFLLSRNSATWRAVRLVRGPAENNKAIFSGNSYRRASINSFDTSES